MNIRSITLSLLISVAAISASAQSYDDPMSQALMKAFDELLDEDPRDPETLVRRAGLYYAHQDYIKALDDINTAMKYYAPDDDESRYPAYQLRAKIYQRQKKYEDALADLNTVLKMSPQDYGTIYQRANVLYELGRYPEANADYYLMLRLNPRSQDALLGQAKVAVKQNNLGTANDLADRAVAMTPNNSEIFIGRAAVRDLMGNRQGAVEDYISAISVDNESTARALSHLVAMSRTDYPTVMAGLSSAISKAPRTGMFYFIRAMIAQGHCNYLAAIADYDKIINENLDSYPGLNGALAECYYYLGRYDRALLNADYAISATDENAFY
ncbi:tetratricopeptide repeat protein, partial [uncultured Duncaniella sp.]